MHDIRSKGVKVDTVYIHYWTDGSLSQFKNHEYDHHALTDWNFFVASHGK